MQCIVHRHDVGDSDSTPLALFSSRDGSRNASSHTPFEGSRRAAFTVFSYPSSPTVLHASDLLVLALETLVPTATCDHRTTSERIDTSECPAGVPEAVAACATEMIGGPSLRLALHPMSEMQRSLISPCTNLSHGGPGRMNRKSL